ncbi:heavy metal translocating P-type ATPase [Phyllobacterium sp. LjRoot231]|uniref:heavy metal translocating P-type ATPase n=1 Tax=Phyllobacterium sp. LjRoot231 TaxID=3342289 RepID=UPI003ECF6FEE
MTETGSGSISEAFTFKVAGMDCGSCANTIKTALNRVPGVSDLKILVATETMSLMLDETATSVSEIEKRVRKLGFEPSLTRRPTAKAAHDAGHVHGPTCNHDAGVHRQLEGHVHEHTTHDHVPHVHGPNCSHDHVAPAIETPASADHLVWKVEGMDCASCAATIRTALVRVPGVSDIRVSVTNETLTLALNERLTPAGTVESKVAALGYKPSRIVQGIDPYTAIPSPRRWWQTPKAKIAITAGALLAASYVASLVLPELSYWAFLLATIVAAAPIARRAVMAALAGAPFTIEMLMTIAATGAVIIGAAEEAAVVVFLFAVGEVLEGFAASKARAGIKALGALVPKSAFVEANGQLCEVAVDTLRIGQIVAVRTGDRIPADGEVVEGMSSVDESPITGESVPRLKEPGAAVFAGSINHEATLRIRVSRAAQDNTIARIITLVEEAQDSKAPTERFIDRFSRIYMPLIVGIAILVAIVPPLGVGAEWGTWIYRALALLLIGCPCALVISVPAAIASSLSSAAKHGLLVKGGAVIEALAGAQTVAFDKTGTLTRGEPVVTDIVASDGNIATFLATVSALEREASHPLAKAIVDRAAADTISPAGATAVKSIAGKGVEGQVSGRKLFIGAPRFAREAGTIDESLAMQIHVLEAEGKTVVVAVANGEAIGLVALRDEPRSDARAGVAALKLAGIDAVMLTGDNKATAAAIARELGVEARAEMMPEDKVTAIRELAEKRKVVMIGDGINDAPALAAAHVGVAMGSGTDVALEAADAALLRNRVQDIATLIGLSRATMRNIRQNVTIALGLKIAFLVTTVLGVTGLWIAVFADTGATVLVTLNAMRLLGYLKKETTRTPATTPRILAAA